MAPTHCNCDGPPVRERSAVGAGQGMPCLGCFFGRIHLSRRCLQNAKPSKTHRPRCRSDHAHHTATRTTHPPPWREHTFFLRKSAEYLIITANLRNGTGERDGTLNNVHQFCSKIRSCEMQFGRFGHFLEDSNFWG